MISNQYKNISEIANSMLKTGLPLSNFINNTNQINIKRKTKGCGCGDRKVKPFNVKLNEQLKKKNAEKGYIKKDE
jgi:hypothetical protein